MTHSNQSADDEELEGPPVHITASGVLYRSGEELFQSERGRKKLQEMAEFAKKRIAEERRRRAAEQSEDKDR